MHFIIFSFPALAPNCLNLWLYIHIKAFLEINAWNKMSSTCSLNNLRKKRKQKETTRKETELGKLLEEETQHDVHSEFNAGENTAKETKCR